MRNPHIGSLEGTLQSICRYCSCEVRAEGGEEESGVN